MDLKVYESILNEFNERKIKTITFINNEGNITFKKVNESNSGNFSIEQNAIVYSEINKDGHNETYSFYDYNIKFIQFNGHININSALP